MAPNETPFNGIFRIFITAAKFANITPHGLGGAVRCVGYEDAKRKYTNIRYARKYTKHHLYPF